jgi:hypothetical protein
MAPDVEEAAASCVYCGFPEAEPEQDGQVGYFSCPECGGDFGYHPLAQDGPLCPAGLPIQVPEERPAVFLGIPVRRPE